MRTLIDGRGIVDPAAWPEVTVLNHRCRPLAGTPNGVGTVRAVHDVWHHRDDRGARLGLPPSPGSLRMQAALDHRGPDGTGVHTTGCGAGADHFRFGLGHKRLSILDLSDAAHQPMTAVGDEVVLSFNGEIYNFIELREELAASGHRFRSSGDTEVLLAAYLEWGADCVARLRGMYSFAVLDLRTSELFAARDLFGIKPFYYAAVPRGWVFASEIKSLLTCEDVVAP